MSKQIRMTVRPQKSNTADQWVETSLPAPVVATAKLKRLTIDIDPDLHTRLKLRCVRQDVRIADWLRDLIATTLDAEKL